MKKSNLFLRTKLLKETKLFVGNTDLSKNTDKQSIFLTILGIKPVSSVSSGHWVKTATGGKSVADNVSEVKNLLLRLGLAFELSQDEFATDAVIALNQKSLDLCKQVKDDREVGLLYGYPKTATDAFIQEKSLSEDMSQKLFLKNNITYAPFKLSKKFYKEEIKILKKWNDLLSLFI